MRMPLLRLWAFINHEELMDSLLEVAAGGGNQWPGWLRELACNEVGFLDVTHTRYV